MTAKFRHSLIVAALIIVLAACFVACDEKPEYYTVTVDADSSIVTAVLSAPKDSTGYQKGETVSITPTLTNDEYEIIGVTANDVALELSDGKYSFVIDGNTVVKISVNKATVSLTVNYDASKGSVSIDSAATSYARGTKVKLTATAKDGYTLNGFILNENVVSADGGSIIITLDADTTVTANFAESMPAEVFASLQGRLKIKGSYFYDADDDSYDFTHDIETVFGENQISQVESDSETGKVYFEYVYGKSNRNLTQITHTLGNAVTEIVSDNLFEEFYNPFDLLSRGDFAKTDENVYVLVDASKAKSATSAISGWNESISKFEVTVENGVATKLHVVTEKIKPSEASETYFSTYDFTLSEHGTASVDTIYTQPYPQTPDHDALTAALTAASQKTAYTIRHQGHEVGYVEPEGGETRPGYGDTDYNVYVTSNVVYDSFKGEEHGYVALNNYIYPFTYLASAKQVTLADPVNVESIDYFKPNYLSFNICLFKKVAENTYALHQNGMASAIAPCFAVGNEQQQYTYATDFTIILKDGMLNQVIFTYKTYGIEETVTLTYDFDTVLDDNLDLDFENADKTSVLDDFIGQYKDDNGNFCQADKSGFTLNGETVQISHYYAATTDNVPYFEGTWNNKIIYISKLTQKQLGISSEDSSVVFILDRVDTAVVEIPDKFHGVWKYKDATYDDTFIFQKYVVKYNGDVLSILSYSETEGLTANYDGKTYAFDIQQVIDTSGNETTALYVIIIDKASATVLDEFHALKSDESVGIEIPADYVGYYMDEKGSYKVTITYSEITINGRAFTPLSYTEQDGFIGSYDGIDNITVSFYGVAGTVNKDKLAISVNGGQILNRTQAFSKNYIGTWASDENSAYKITIEFTETTLAINDRLYPIKYNDEYGYEVYLNKDDFSDEELYATEQVKYILFSYNIYGNPIMVIYDDVAMQVVLFKQTVLVPDKFIGSWTGSYGGSDVTATVLESGVVTFKFGSGAEQTAKAKHIKADDELSFTLNGKTASFIYHSDTKQCELYQADDYPSGILFTKNYSFTTAKELRKTWSLNGTSLTVNEHDIVFQIEGEEAQTIIEATFTNHGNVYQFTFYIDENKYYAEYGTYGDSLMIIINGGKGYYMLDLATA